MSTESLDFSQMTENGLKRLGACYVGSALGCFGRIPVRSVVPLECSSRRYWFRVGKMHFDLIRNDDDTLTLYAVSDDGGQSIAIGGVIS